MRYVTRLWRRLGMVMAVLFGAALLVTWIAPQATRSQEDTQNSGEESAHKPVLDKDPKGNPIVSGELLVSYKRGASKRAADEAPKEVEGRVDKDFPDIEVHLLSFPEVKNERAQEARQRALERNKEVLQRNPNVEAVDYNHVRKVGWTPNDPYYEKQWGYPKIRAPEAWDQVWGNGGSKVAVIDSGIVSGHAEFWDQVGAERDFVNDDYDAEDDNGHGTHVAGTVAAETNNGVGVAGTCPTCTLLIAKAVNADGKSYDSDVIESINWAVSYGADVINMSFGGPEGSSAVERAINNAWDKGVVLVAAAMNDGRDDLTVYPAAYENVIAVAATDQNDQRAYFSNAGDWVDVAAPGVDIYSTYLPTLGSYRSASGTSTAAPHVSGLAGLLASKGYSNSEVRKRIESTAFDLGATGKDPEFGWGLIDAEAAFVCVPDTCPPEAKPPAQSFVAPSTLGTSYARGQDATLPVKLDWSAIDRGGSGIARYELQQSTNSGAYANVSLPSATATSTPRYLDPNNAYRFRVRAQDTKGNWSDWADGPGFRLSAYQENSTSVAYPSGTWTYSYHSSSYYGGYVKYTTICGATAKLSFTGSNAAWVSNKGPYEGKAGLWVDGTWVANVDLYAATEQARQVVFAKGGLDPSKGHTIEVKKTFDSVNYKTGYTYCNTQKSVDVDAFMVLQDPSTISESAAAA